MDWKAFGSAPILRLVLGLVVVAAVVTLVALALLWPSGDGTRQATVQAGEVGLNAKRYTATVDSAFDGDCSYATQETPHQCRFLTFVVADGPYVGELVALPEFNLEYDAVTPDIEPGDEVILGYEPSTASWYYADLDRRPSLILLTVLFAVVVIALGRWRGVTALAGMAMTVVVLVMFVAPSVLDGNNPIVVSVVAASLVAFISLYLTHGFNPTTTVALAGTLAALVLTLGVAALFFRLARFTGLATEEALLLPFVAGDINLSALLLGGAMLGTLGALDDVTVTQVATVAEIGFRRPDLGPGELVASGIRVGREHIASTVNTLLLAYAGASMPLLLLFAASDTPWGFVANSEIISTEIVRTLCGSIGLVAAVPITTVLAALVVAGPGASHAPLDGDLDDEGEEEDGPESGPDLAAESVEAIDLVEQTEADALSEVVEASAASELERSTGPDQLAEQPAPSWDDFAPEPDQNW